MSSKGRLADKVCRVTRRSRSTSVFRSSTHFDRVRFVEDSCILLLAFIRVFLKWIEWRRIFIRIISLGLSFFKFLISFSFDVSVIPTYARAAYIIKFYFYLRVKIMIV